MAVVTLTKENFDNVINENSVVLVDFWASWCGPCRMLAPIIKEIAEEADDVVIGKVDVDEEGDLAKKFGIMSIPTILVFKDGKIAEKSVGLKSKAAILEMLPTF
ncbi:MAG: thioredoxin [Oscillospiraceae bacterium]|nr:thioredoxin [Oscillospiraceae bacterium]